MLYYALKIENYYETLTKSKKFKPKEKNEKTFKSFTKKLNKMLNRENNSVMRAYVLELDENAAEIIGSIFEEEHDVKDLIRYVGLTFCKPPEILCGEIREEDFNELLKTAVESRALPKKIGESVLAMREIETIVQGLSNATETPKNTAYECWCDHPYKELKALIGLESVKKLADQIIASTVMDKKRSTINNKIPSSTKHMIFTGEPGSAKTTVARLLAGALKEKGALETGVFVECGRQDLVGKYTGWTAAQVSEKFVQAKGGVLFIDEAYSLASNDDFGQEAINTIVQEMENHRDDVIVIFAGYPDKMESFLNQNQGLKSRIAFHVDFPNYNVAELVDIFKKMSGDKGFTMEEEGLIIVKEMCEAASSVPDFGNGRFVRNILEQAILKQSERLFATYGTQEVPERELFTLKKEDINFSYTPFKDEARETKTKNKIGFVA
ncbi:MAG: AAA family ATPase [Phascolarctobacterium sp.]|nr:AAA family ATPase [Phascolarctobacterium sp.]